MSLYYEDGGLRLWHGSNKDVLPTFADEAFDSIVTDPPYELGFMGKGWDSSGIAYDVEMWREVFRVLKPGGHLLAFGGTRTWHRIAVAIEDAGFEVRDSIAWMYGSGMPKSHNVAKAIDKAAGFVGDVMGSETVDIGMQGGNLHAGRSREMATRDVRALSPEAAEWEGWGTALKPAFEPIIVARKPLTGTVAANVQTYGTGAVNIDACRVDFVSDADRRESTEKNQHAKFGTKPGQNKVWGDYSQTEMKDYDGSKGRWPANVLLDESQAEALDEQSGFSRDGVAVNRNRGETRPMKVAGAPERVLHEDQGYGGSGGASRFFPIFRYVAKAPGSERPEVDGVEHETVKPLELMRWLVRLVTRRGGRVLDIFAGSGTTGEAALLEGCEVDLIELEAPHLPLILARVRKPLQPSIFGDWDGDTA